MKLALHHLFRPWKLRRCWLGPGPWLTAIGSTLMAITFAVIPNARCTAIRALQGLRFGKRLQPPEVDCSVVLDVRLVPSITPPMVA